MRASAILGLAFTRKGIVVSAEKAFSSAIDLALEAKLSFGATPMIANLADVQLARGKLNNALASCEDAISLGTVDGKRVASTGFASLEKGKILYERNSLQEAAENLREALDLLSQGGITQSFGNIHSVLALVEQAQGQRDEALTLAQEAVELANRGGIERLAVLAKAYQARVWLAQGATGLAVQWADEYVALEAVEYLQEFEDLTLAQVRLALDRPKEALALLETLLVHAESYDRINSVIHIAVLRALALDALGESEEALNTLRQVLNLAMPEGYRRVFLNQGLPMAHLLYLLSLKESDQAYIAGLLGDFEKDPALARVENVLSETGSQLKPSILVEPLSEREAEVLALLAGGLSNGGLSNREIAERLVLSPHTIRSYTSNLYGKLGVHSRTQAVARARELGLLA
jgi:LuxR family maltose regulon positive regulatory protein